MFLGRSCNFGSEKPFALVVFGKCLIKVFDLGFVSSIWVCMYNCGIIPVVLYRCIIQLSQTE
jgi:hypothetical protein